MRERPTGDEGSVMVLVLGLLGVLVLLVGVVVDVSAAVLAKRAAASAADGAAVAGAQGIDYPTFYARGPEAGVPLSEAAVRRLVAGYGGRATGDQPALRLSARVDGGGTAVVVATRSVALPFSGRLGVDRVQVRAEARARAPLAPQAP